MFTGLGPLFKTVFRETEQSDARLEIRREEKEQQRKNRDQKGEDDNAASLWEDTTGVSVTALQTFLIEFLKEKTPDTADSLIGDIEGKGPLPPSAGTPISPEAARAAKAYGSTARHNAHAPAAPVETSQTLTDQLASDEVRAIHHLINDLDILAKAGVETLNFQMNGTFVESFADAVRLQKKSLGL